MEKLKKFDSWLANSFWYYNKWYVLLGVFVVSFVTISIISSILTVEYDWTIVYAHQGSEDREASAIIETLIKKYGEETTGNRRIDVELIEIAGVGNEMEGAGEHNAFLGLNLPECYIMAVDEALFQKYNALGYFDALDIVGLNENRVYLSEAGVYLTLNKSKALQYTLEEAQEVYVTEEQLLEVNAALEEEHEEMYRKAKETVSRIATT